MNYMANQIAYHGLEQSFIKKIFLNSNNQEQYQDLLTMSSWVDKNNELVINSIHGNLKQKINLNNRKYLEKIKNTQIIFLLLLQLLARLVRKNYSHYDGCRKQRK